MTRHAGDNWGRWGDADEAGALNLVDDAVTVHAASLVSSGQTFSLAQPLGPSTPAPPHRPRPLRFMNRDAGDYALGARSPGGFRFAEDTVQFAVHSGTHVDALAHAWSGDELFNGHAAASTRTTRGAQRCGAEKLRPALTRGILLDIVPVRGRPMVASEAVTVSDLEQALARSSEALIAGDAVLVRTGWWESQRNNPGYFDLEPGIDASAAQWLADHEVSIVGADNYAVEQQTAEGGFPAHLILLHRYGVPLIENLELAALAQALENIGRSSFLFVFAPLPLTGSTGSPLNPIAVL